MGDTILVVEDDTDLRELIRMAGEKRSYTVAEAANGLDAMQHLGKGRIPELIILDINMPGLDGFGFCRWLRDDFPRIPVIFLSARTEEYDKIVALEIGGDDYLTKPFSMKELYIRVQVALRRVRLYSQSGDRECDRIVLGELSLDEGRWICEYRHQAVVLTVSEFRLLRKLAGSPDMVQSRAALAGAAFPDDTYNTGRSIDIHICRLRQKLLAVNPCFDLIETVYQMGYKWKQ